MKKCAYIIWYMCGVLGVLPVLSTYITGVYPTHMLHIHFKTRKIIYTCIISMKHVYYRWYAHVFQVYTRYKCNTPETLHM